MSQNRIVTCPRCGRVLMGAQPCPNCAGGYASYSAESYGYTSQSNAPRWLLLVGALLLLFLLVAVVSLRRSGPVMSSPEPTVSMALPQENTPLPTPPRPTPESAEEREFWRRKAARELREAEHYEPTAEEKAAYEQMRVQDHEAITGQSRATDYYVRRPELIGRRP